MEKLEQTKQSLLDKIISDRNIYNAIYCMESYIFEKGLLDIATPVKGIKGEILANNDLELFYALGDKFNFKLIDKVIEVCQQRLNKMLASHEDLFEVTVFFKLKGLDENTKTLKLRPLHTASLLDMICMVSILMCLMFDDSDKKRKLSDLSKLIPHNFYGNVPSSDVKYLFKRWQSQYQEYTQNVIEHCRTYQKTHRFLTEVCLDIKNFFPSVSPQFLYDYILDKLSATYTSEEDKDMLRMAVSKLLFFKVKEENVKPWIKDYYGKESVNEVEGGIFMNYGIPQGLPQSYFFGNLCMIEVKKQLMKQNIFKGDAYFYVDDSVIYIQAEMDEHSFNDRIKDLNSCLENFCKKHEHSKKGICKVISQKYLDLQKQLSYIICFHEDGKSTFCHIDNADNYLDGIETIRRETSMSSNLYENLDDIDDSISYKKLSTIITVVDKEISTLKSRAKRDSLAQKEASRLKMLKRFKRFYLFRVRMLKLKTGENTVDELHDEFKKCFLDKKDLNKWFDKNEEEIFQAEYRLLVQKSSLEDGQDVVESVVDFEQRVLEDKRNESQASSDYLYFKKDAICSKIMKSYATDNYASLKVWVKENYCQFEGMLQNRQFKEFEEFLNNDFKEIQDKGFRKKEYTKFVLLNSSEYQRRILNAFYSATIGVLCSDNCSFIKANSRTMNYTELRILIRLRNWTFELDDFCAFIRKLEDKDISNQMGIDMALLSVVGIFVRFVRNPEWIDCLILTHRITKGLWYNGSKFLNSYTLHNEEHAVTLINQSVHIVRTIDYLTIKNVDYYILFLACYLHDISMVIHPDMYVLGASNSDSIAFVSEQMLKMKEAVDSFSVVKESDTKNARMKEAGTFLAEVFDGVYGYFENKVRSQHPQDSANFILSKSNSLLNYLEPTLLSFVSKVSDSHGWDVMDVYGLKSRAKSDTVSVKYLMILIRLADLFDVSNERVNYHLLRQNLNFLPKVSQFHWISHLVTDKLEFDADYTVFPERDLCSKPILETLIVDLFLNVKYLATSGQCKKCKYCQCTLNDNSICIDIKSEPGYTCQSTECTLLCNWMMKKHEWLIPELKALNDYLFSVNNSLIQTRIKVRINYADEMKLDADLFDSVVEYLQEES